MYNPKYAHEYYLKHKDELNKKKNEWRKKHLKRSSEYVHICRNKQIEKLKEQGIINPWSVLVGKAEPKYIKDTGYNYEDNNVVYTKDGKNIRIDGSNITFKIDE